MALLGGAVIAPLVAFTAAMFVLANQDVPPPAVTSTFVPMNDATTVAPDRPVYQHSVIPGGVYSREELQGVLAIDSVAADHHREIVLDAVHPAHVPAPRLVYMSYRVGNKIAWTKHRVLLAAGETILTDGVNEIRARCGNGISDVLRQPTSNAEPGPEAFDRLTEPITYGASGPGPIGEAAPPLGGSALNVLQFAAPTLAPLGDRDPGGVFRPSLVPLGAMTSFASPQQRLNPDVLPGLGMPLAPQVLQAPSASPDGNDQLPPDVPNDDAFEEDGPDDGVTEPNVPGHFDDPNGMQPPPASSNDPGIVSEIIDPVIIDGPNIFEPGVPIIDWPEEQNPTDSPDSHSIPEPATLFLVGAGVAATMVRHRRMWRWRGEDKSCRR